MADIRTLLGLGLNPAEDPNALARELRGQTDLGDVLSLSTIPQVAALGQSRRKRAIGAATRGGRLLNEMREREQEREIDERDFAYQQERDALADERYAAELAREQEARALTQARLGTPEPFTRKDTGETVMLQPTAQGTYVDSEGNPVSLSGLEPYEESRKPGAYKPFTDPEGKVVHIRADGKGGLERSDGMPVNDLTNYVPYSRAAGKKPAQVRADYAAAQADLSRGRAMLTQLKANPGTVDILEDTFADIAGILPGNLGMRARAAAIQKVKSPQERAVLVSIDRYVGQLRHAMYGAQLTRYEGMEASKWHPLYAANHEDAVMRLEQLIEDVEASQREREKEYGFGGETPEPAAPERPARVSPAKWDSLNADKQRQLIRMLNRAG